MNFFKKKHFISNISGNPIPFVFFSPASFSRRNSHTNTARNTESYARSYFLDAPTDTTAGGSIEKFGSNVAWFYFKFNIHVEYASSDKHQLDSEQ